MSVVHASVLSKRMKWFRVGRVCVYAMDTAIDHVWMSMEKDCYVLSVVCDMSFLHYAPTFKYYCCHGIKNTGLILSSR